MKTIDEVLKEVAHRHPRVVLTDGKKEWTVEHLLGMAESDKGASGQAGEEAENRAYFWGYMADGKISIAKDAFSQGTYPVLVSVGPAFSRKQKLPSGGVFKVKKLL
jgi:hypothetical protein